MAALLLFLFFTVSLVTKRASVTNSVARADADNEQSIHRTQYVQHAMITFRNKYSNEDRSTNQYAACGSTPGQITDQAKTVSTESGANEGAE